MPMKWKKVYLQKLSKFYIHEVENLSFLSKTIDQLDKLETN